MSAEPSRIARAVVASPLEGAARMGAAAVSAEPSRILIVEDEVLIAFELESLLQDIGHDPVGIAATSGEACAIADDLRPDFALVDVHLADGPTGVEVARTLTAQGTGVLFMTANPKRIPQDFAGAYGVIGKPYTERAVRNALRYVAGRLAGRDEPSVPDGLALSPAWAGRRPPPNSGHARRSAP